MSPPSANTLLPTSVRIAKIVGTVGSAYVAGNYLAHSRATIPALLQTSSSGNELIRAVYDVLQKVRKPLQLITLTSSTAFGYVAYYLYNTPALMVPLASITMTPGSFLPHTESTELIIGGGWEAFAIPAGLLAAVLPFEFFGLRTAEKNLVAAGKSLEVTERNNMGVQAVSDTSVRRDAEAWRKANLIRGTLVGVAAAWGAYAVAVW